MSFKNVVIIGAGGNLGPTILKTFFESGAFNVSVLTREGSTSTFPSEAKVVRADYSSVDSLTSAFKGADAVISLVGGQGFGEQQKLVDAAIAAGVKRFIPSDFGSDVTDPRALELVPIFKAKIEATDYLHSKEDAISWTSIINGPFFDWGLSPKTPFIGIDANTKTATLIDGGNEKFATTNLRQIGTALIKVLQNPDLTKNQHVFVSSFTVSQREILAAAEKITGQKWTVKDSAGSDLRKEGGEKLSKGDFSGIMDLIKNAAFGKDGLKGKSYGTEWNEKLGLPKEDFEESVKAGLAGKVYGE